MEERGVAAYAAEFIGTFFLVLFICFILTVNKGGLGYFDWAVIGLLHAFVLMMLIHTLGDTSGAHFNPVVTATLAALRKIAPVDAVIYILLQLAGAVCAALVVKAMLVDEQRVVHDGATLVSPLLSGKTLGGAVAELIGTFVLMWAIMGMAVNPRAERGWAGFVIGATLGFAVMVFGPLTGAGFNPARAFGPSLVAGGEDVGKFLVVYVAGPLVGALLAGFSYTLIVLKQQGERPVDKLSEVPE